MANLQSVLEQLQAEQDAQMRYELSRLNRELNLARDQVRVQQDKLQDAEVLNSKKIKFSSNFFLNSENKETMRRGWKFSTQTTRDAEYQIKGDN